MVYRGGPFVLHKIYCEYYDPSSMSAYMYVYTVVERLMLLCRKHHVMSLLGRPHLQAILLRLVTIQTPWNVQSIYMYMLCVATTSLRSVPAATKPNNHIDRWGKLLRPEKGDPTPDVFVPRDDFTFIVVTAKDEELPKEALAWMTVIRVGDAGQQKDDGDKDAHVDKELAGLFGAVEVKRVSLAMVEAAFDG